MNTSNRLGARATVVALAIGLAFSGVVARAQPAQEHEAHHPGGSTAQATPAPTPMPGPAQQRGMPGMMGGQGMQGGGQQGGMPGMMGGQGMQMQGAPGAGQQGGVSGMMGDMGRMMDMMHRQMAAQHTMRVFERIEGTLAFYRTELRITDAQQAQWNAFADAVRSAAGALKQAVAKAMQESGQVPAPEQIDRRLALLTAQAEALRTVQAAARPLYAALSEEQKRTADTLMAEHLRGMGGGMRGGMM
ncbi:Spy/CpxP family protein refolding chaperone [Roseicella aquatilis]|nr:Spy/CpxP family protein refolding chaperone [Roseicella aquatilis]